MLIFGMCSIAIADSVSPDRPTASMGAQALQASQGQFELGVVGFEHANSPFFAASGLFRYGIGDEFEIRLESMIDQNGDELLVSPGVKWTAPSLSKSIVTGLAVHPNLPIRQPFSFRAFALTTINLNAFSVAVNAGGLVDMSEGVTFQPQGSLALSYQRGSWSPFIEAVGLINTEFTPSFGAGILHVDEQMAFDLAGTFTPAVGVHTDMSYALTLGWTFRFAGK